jgi:hypothetical protein
MAMPTLLLPLALICLSFRSVDTAAASEVETLVRVPPLQMVDGVLISPDGKAVATLRHEGNVLDAGGNSLTLQLWTIPKGILLWTAKEHVSRLLSFSPDGSRLVGVAEDGTGVFWKSANGRVKLKLPRQRGEASVKVPCVKPVHTVQVREVVEFALRRGDLGAERQFVGSDRAMAGIRGHQKIQRSRPTGYQTEIPVEHTVDAGEFTVRVRGRIGGLLATHLEVLLGMI